MRRRECDEFLDQRDLGGVDLGLRDLDAEPLGAIGLGKDLSAPRTRWPLHLEGIARDARDVEVAAHPVGMHVLSRSLTDLAEIEIIAERSGAADLFGELTQC